MPGRNLRVRVLLIILHALENAMLSAETDEQGSAHSMTRAQVDGDTAN
jgi:hypothetical protein